jgi:tetratricopeptide (TPR) repeat protein
MLSACSTISDERPEPIRKSEYYLEHGVSAFTDSDYIAATDFFNKALAHYRSIDDTTGILLSQINLAETALASGNFTASEQHIRMAESVVQREDLDEYRPRLTLLHAQMHWRTEQQQEALQLLHILLPQFDENDLSKTKPDLLLIGATTLRTDIAFAHIAENKIEAYRWLRRLSLMLQSAKDATPQHKARLLRFEAHLAFLDGTNDSAFLKLEQALQHYRHTASRPAIAATLTEIGQLLMNMEQWHKAEESLQRALYIRLWMMDRRGAKQVMQMLLTIYHEMGDEVRAQQMLEELNKINKP